MKLKPLGTAVAVGVADPSIYRFDAYTSTCVKLTKSETKKVAKSATAGTSAKVFALTLCAYTGSITGVAACVAVITAVADSLKSTFRSAAKSGKCVVLHFLGIAGALWKWKSVKC